MKRLMMVVVTALAMHPGVAPAQTSSLTIEQLRQILADQRNQIRSMQGSFTMETRPDREAEASKAMRGIVRKLKVQFAWSGDKRLFFQEGDIVTDNMKIVPTHAKNVYDGKDFRRREFKLHFPKKPMNWPIETWRGV
ncbi:MAG: hypothetical protein L0Z62_24770 [Gemmataceae bacterium]|nr:hypothetical protein [Gemmataceae bacterium]